MLGKPTMTLVPLLAFVGGVLATPTAALADPPWARGGYGYHRGGPPPWAPAHGWRRKQEYGGYHGRSYGGYRSYEGRRYGGYDRYGY